MTDVKIENGDIVLDSSGNTVLLNDFDARFQQAVVCIKSKKGSFVYDRELGSELDSSKNLSAAQTEFEINAALARFDGVTASVTDSSEGLCVKLTIDGETRVTEVY